MPAVTITPADLAPFATIETEKADAMIADALALAALVAPCITSEDFTYDAAAKAIIRGAILRWNDSGSGAFSQVTTGPFGAATDTRTTRKGMFLPSELDDLKALCSEGGSGKAFSVDTVGTTTIHSDSCSLNFGALYCSCGADIAGFPLFDPEP